MQKAGEVVASNNFAIYKYDTQLSYLYIAMSRFHYKNPLLFASSKSRG